MKKYPIGILLPVCLGVLLWSGMCAAAEFTADCIHSAKFSAPAGPAKNARPGMDGTRDYASKLLVKGNKEREETDRGRGGKSITITRKDKGVVWVLFPERKEYMEISLKDGGRMPGIRQPMPDATGKKKSLGKATVNGYSCDKYQITNTFKPRGSEKSITSTTTIWESSKLGRSIKIEMKSSMSTSSTELKNIKQTKLSDSLFEIPKGYKKGQFTRDNTQRGGPPRDGVKPPSKNK